VTLLTVVTLQEKINWNNKAFDANDCETSQCMVLTMLPATTSGTTYVQVVRTTTLQRSWQPLQHVLAAQRCMHARHRAALAKHALPTAPAAPIGHV
jgi:hypothetical protein